MLVRRLGHLDTDLMMAPKLSGDSIFDTMSNLEPRTMVLDCFRLKQNHVEIMLISSEIK